MNAEECLKVAFNTDVRAAASPMARERNDCRWTLDAFRASGYLTRITAERSARAGQSVSSYA